MPSKTPVDRSQTTRSGALQSTSVVDRKFLTAIYVKSKYFNGQGSAAELVVQGLRQRGWQILTAEVNGVDRNGHPLTIGWRILTIFLLTLIAWFKALACGRQQKLYVALGQTKFSLIREGLPLLIRGLLSPKALGIISLHGHNFTQWRSQALEAKLLRSFAKAAQYITVLGFVQKEKLVALGVPEDKVVIMDNSCDLQPIAPPQLQEKHAIGHGRDANHPITVLFLSNLIEQKGYLQFVEALALLAQSASAAQPDSGQPPRFIDAVLCGPLTLGREPQPRFATLAAATTWLEQQMAQINQSDSVRLRWIRGAAGEAKEALFRQAQIFVLPSTYASEAQPIVVLEALASGCTVVTTRIGELPTTVNPETALFLENTKAATIATALVDLIENPELRLRLATNGLHLFHRRFSYEQHIDRWENLLESLQS